jgi:hypothetical protein
VGTVKVDFALIITAKARSTALRGKQQNEASLSGSNFRNLYVKKHFFFAKKSRTVRCTVKKCLNVFVYNSRTGRDISKIPTDSDSAGRRQVF